MSAPATMLLPASPAGVGRRQSAAVAFVRAALRSPKAVFGLVILLLLVACASASRELAPFDPNAQSLAMRLLPILSHGRLGELHVLGTDHLGRDILSRLIYGSRISLLVGVSAAVLAGVVGVLLGLAAGYLRGWTDGAIMRACDVQLALPYILIAIAVLAVTDGGVFTIVAVLSQTQWVTYCRVTRAATLTETGKDYVQAGRALGLGHGRIMLRYILPNVLAPIIVIATFSVAQTIIAESALSFLGLGMPTSIPSWGGMLADGRSYLVIAWWVAALPGACITLTAIGINLFGDWLRDYLDPRLGL